VRRRRPDEHHQPRQGRGDDELLADRTDQEAYNRLGQAADADHAARQGILNQAGHAAGQHSTYRSGGQRHIDDRHQNYVDCRRAGHDETRQGRLQCERQRDRD
jgi:hypothetical protein